MSLRRAMAGLFLAASLLSQPCYADADSVVVFNEISYNPAGSSENGEWIELFNQMGIKVDISGWHFDGINYTFPSGTILNPGSFVVVAKTPSSGQFGPFTGNLSNSGETLQLINQSGRMMDEIDYNDNDPWAAGPDNSGATLAKLRPYTASDVAENWSVSSQVGGTPGAENFPTQPTVPAIRFHEISAASAAAGGFFVELANTGTTSLNYGSMVISRGSDTAGQYTLPAGSLAPGALLLLNEATLGFRPANDEKLFLFNAGKTQLIDARQTTNRLRGLATANGSDWLYPNTATPGTANDFTFSDAVVISEVQYNPPGLPPTPELPAVYQTSTLFSYNSVWRYNPQDEALPSGWAASSHAVGGNWKSGTDPIGVENSTLSVPLVTVLSPYSKATVTYYFERDFSLTQAEVDSADALEITHQIDDGAVLYLNGVEIGRFNMPTEGVIGPETRASNPVDNAVLQTLSLPASALVSGTNRISVEVHQYSTESTDLVFGMKLDLKRVISPFVPSQPLRDSNNQWLEIANRSTSPIDLGGWSFSEGITHTFTAGTVLNPGEQACVVRDPALFAAAYPNARILGTFTGSLSRTGENIVLSDPNQNPADAFHYHDGGQWPEFADGGGTSMELRDLDADNTTGDSWSSSDETSKTAWKSYSYSFTATASNGPDSQWSEFNLGMLGAGEIWIDDISVIESPTSSPTQKLVDGGLNNTSLWRLRGNHRHSQILSEPGNPGNKILRMVATGPTEHMHNQIETTLASSIVNGRDYQVSFRARWVRGINQVHSRLYFNRGARVTVIDRPADPGTPSAANSTAVANAGPSFSGLNHSPAVPAAYQSCTISAASADPDGITSMTLFYSVNGGTFQSTAMTLSNGRYQGNVPGQAAGAIVQFYLKGIDALGVIAYFPAAAANSRALYQVNNNAAASNGLHNFRLITTLADRDFMHTDTEVMSNDRIEATVIDREGDIYYGAGVRLKSSQRGRANTSRVGYNIDFSPDALYRGVHAGLAVDRSEGQEPGQRELLFDMMISNSGGPISRYNDLIKIISPNSALTGTALLQMARYEDVFLDEQFENGSDGALYEYELVYYPTTTNAAKAKLPQPDAVLGVGISDLGDDKERYRWHFLNKINREADHFDPIIQYCKLFSKSGADFEAAVSSTVDVDTWLRGMAYAVLTGAGDNAAAGSQHNAIYYAHPDGKVVFLPHDLDYAFDAARSIFANAECAALTANPARMRMYLGHLHDIISTTYHNSYMSIWSSHFAALDPAQDWAAELSYMTSRSNNVLSQINAKIPSVGFAITTPSPLTTGSLTATISGKGWINVRDIRVAGTTTPLTATWTDSNTWQVAVAAVPGLHTVSLEAVDFSGAVIGTGSISVNATTIVEPASSANLVISEIMYHPADTTQAEIAAGFTDPEAFEFIELMNIGANTINLTGVRFTAGIQYDFPSGSTLSAGARLVIARNPAAFQFRHPEATAWLQTGALLNGSGLDNAGESLLLTSSSGTTIRSFSYADEAPWPLAADGDGYSLVLLNPTSNPDHSLPENWRSSAVPFGNPGISDSMPLPTSSTADQDHDGIPALVEYALGSSDIGHNETGIFLESDPDGLLTVRYQLSLAADQVRCEIQSSENLVNWNSNFIIVSETPTGEGTVQIVARSQSPAPSNCFIRLAVSNR